MQNLSSHVEPQDALEIDLVQIRLWRNQDDSEIEYYDCPGEIINYLQVFILKGEINPEIAFELRSALNELPMWKDLNITELTREQRECIAAVFVRSKGRRLDLAFRMQLNANVF